MKVLIEGKVYDSLETPILLQFDENEQSYFNDLEKFVSAPEESTKEEREELINKSL